jgi:16S rRNA (guanine966-N2)-methyltransferase
MRIVAGVARGRRLVAPPGDAVRPTADRVREALFASLAPLLPGASVLDAFAGSGALGLEARSRGADSATFIERERRALDTLRRNIAAVGLDGTTVIAADAVRTLRDAAQAGVLAGSPFDLVLLDPPYALQEDVLATLLADLVPLLAEGATVVIERSAGAPEPRWPTSLLATTPRRYGSTRLYRATLAEDGADVGGVRP